MDEAQGVARVADLTPGGRGDPSPGSLAELLAGIGKVASRKIGEAIEAAWQDSADLRKALSEVRGQIEFLLGAVEAHDKRLARVEQAVGRLAGRPGGSDAEAGSPAGQGRELQEVHESPGMTAKALLDLPVATTEETLDWLKSTVTFDEYGMVLIPELMREYRRYCLSIRRRPVSTRRMAQLIRVLAEGRPVRSAYLGMVHGEARRGWIGIRWANRDGAGGSV